MKREVKRVETSIDQKAPPSEWELRSFCVSQVLRISDYSPQVGAREAREYRIKYQRDIPMKVRERVLDSLCELWQEALKA